MWPRQPRLIAASPGVRSCNHRATDLGVYRGDAGPPVSALSGRVRRAGHAMPSVEGWRDHGRAGCRGPGVRGVWRHLGSGITFGGAVTAVTRRRVEQPGVRM